MNNKKAFTLVELIAVIGLLGILITVVATNVVGKLKDINSKLDGSLERIFLSSVEDYVNDNINDFSLNSNYSNCVLISTVIDNGYLSLDTFNSQDKIQLNNTFFRVKNVNKKFQYSIDYDGFCKIYDEYSILDTTDNLNTKSPWNNKTNIEQIKFLNEMPDSYRNDYLDDSATVYDLSSNHDGSILAEFVDENNNSLYELFIATNGKIKANTNASNLFKDFTNLKIIDFNETFSTLGVINYTDMFSGCIKLEVVKVGEEFAFGENGYLPVQNSSNITGADGNWYNTTTNTSYAPSLIPNNVSATYTSIIPLSE